MNSILRKVKFAEIITNNMKIQLLFFGITTDLVGMNSTSFDISVNATVKELKEQLIDEFSTLKNIDQFAIAVNESYANDDLIIVENDVVAIIPPVSGG